MLSLPGSVPQKPNLRKLGAEKNDKKLLLLVLKKKDRLLRQDFFGKN